MEPKDAITCARGGDVDFFKTVEREILLKARSINDESVLTVAAICGHLDCCEVIVERCPQLLYYQGYEKGSVLHSVAACQGDNNVENIMRFLITADSKPDLERGGMGNISNKWLLTMKDSDGDTALHWAVIWRNHGATKLLLEADRDFQLLRTVDSWGRTCLHLAAEEDDHVSVELLIKAMPDIEFLKMTAARRSNQTALHVAAKQGNLEMVKLICEADPDKQLLSMPDEQGNTPLHFAVVNSNLEIARFLIEENRVTVYCAVNKDNQTPLSMAMDKAARDGSGSDAQVICKVLLENDSTKAVDFHGQNVLHVAAYHGHLAVVQHFLESKDTGVVALFNS